MRRLLGTLVAVVISVVGVVGLIAFFNSRDESTTQAPAQQATVAPSGDALLEAGNVVLRYSDPAATAPLEELAKGLGAPDTPELRAAGQAVILRRTPGTQGVEARAQSAKLEVADPADPALQAFLERWLGEGARG